MLYDEHPDSIYNYLTQRDNIGMSDYFGVYLDPYNQGLMAFGFFITPAGVQTDIKATKSDFDSEDGAWSAVWESKTRITEKGWIVEMKIPYSALRFPAKTTGPWGLNMFRNIRRYNSNNSWSLVDRKVSGFIHQQGELTGIKEINTPVRLSVTPYTASYYEPQGSGSKFFFKGGMDLKYGLNDAFTLDMMLIPDYGQIQSDDQELNLSPYEIYYNEKRQFFTEGTELFQRAGVFYSRRIGAQPKFSSEISLGDEESITYNPSETQLVNATKISGRTDKGLGIGVMNAMSLPSYAKVKDALTDITREVNVQPFTNYNVFVLDQSLKNNSYVSLINTNVSMWDSPFSANVTGTQFEIRDKSMKYALKGTGAFSTRQYQDNENGFIATLALEKNKGKFFWGVKQTLMSDKYNPNDLGYLQFNNHVTSEAWLFYNMIKPNKIFREWNADVWCNYNRMYVPNVFTDNQVGYDFNSRFRNNFSVNLDGKYTGPKNDYFEPRVDGRFYLRPAEWKNSVNFTTDDRKRFVIQVGNEIILQPFSEMFQQQYHTEIDLRLGQRFNLSYLLGYQYRKSEKGFTDLTNDQILFSKRDVSTLLNTLEMNFVINNKMGITMRSRHYWSAVENREHFYLQSDGNLQPAAAYFNYNLNYNAFTVDMLYRWVFMPGSELTLAWKSNAYLSESQPVFNYVQNLQNSWQNISNSFSLKMIFYIDYNNILGVKLKNRS